MLDCQLYGLWPAGHFLTNLLLHSATVVALFFVLRKMTGEVGPSALVALLLAIHPQHVESVAWLAERRDVLSGLLFMLTLGAYVGYVQHNRSPARYLLVCFLLALGLMAKPMLATVPALLLLLDYWPLGRLGGAEDLPRGMGEPRRESFGRLVVEKLPLAALALADAAMTLKTHVPALAPTPLVRADRLCAGGGDDLFGAQFRPAGVGPVLSLSPGRSVGVARRRVAGGADGLQRGRGAWAARISLLVCRLVLVLGNVAAGLGRGLHLGAGHGGSLHVPAGHWAVSGGGVWRLAVGSPFGRPGVACWGRWRP